MYSRKFAHVLFVFLLSLVGYVYYKQTFYVLILFTILYIPFDIYRLKLKDNNNIIFRIFDFFVVKKDYSRITALSFHLLSLLFIMLFFDRYAFLYSNVLLAFCDPAAAIIGSSFKRKNVVIFKEKTLYGSLAFFVTSFIINSIFLKNVLVILGLSLVYTLIEIVTSYYDNAILTIVSALLYSILK